MCVHDTFAINSESAVNSNKKSAKCKVFLDFASFFGYNCTDVFSRVKEVDIDEDDLSTEKKRQRSKVHGFVQECVLQAEEKFWLPEEQKVERNYQLRAQTLWSFPSFMELFFGRRIRED